MRNPHPFNCDVCGQAKQPSNNWLLGRIGQVLLEQLIKDGVMQEARLSCAIAVSLWDDTLALVDDVAHICGIECAAKWSTKKFDELKSK